MRQPVLLGKKPFILVTMVAVSKIVFAFLVKILKNIQKLAHFDALTIRTFPNRLLYKRPKKDKYICPPPIKLAQIKKICPKCKRVFNDHKRNHHILHNSCQICSHMKRASEMSFKLSCCKKKGTIQV